MRGSAISSCFLELNLLPILWIHSFSSACHRFTLSPSLLVFKGLRFTFNSILYSGIPVPSTNFQPLVPFHPEQVEGSLPILWIHSFSSACHRFIYSRGVACLLCVFLQYLIELFFSFNEDSSRFTTLKWFNKASILKLINNSSSPGIAKTESAL